MTNSETGVAAAARPGRTPRPPQTALLRRRLSIRSRRARQAADYTQRQVAQKLGWSTIKLRRIEGAYRGTSPGDVDALAAHYGIEADELEHWRALATPNAQHPWSVFRNVVPEATLDYFALEAVADTGHHRQQPPTHHSPLGSTATMSPTQASLPSRRRSCRGDRHQRTLVT